MTMGARDEMFPLSDQLPLGRSAASTAVAGSTAVACGAQASDAVICEPRPDSPAQPGARSHRPFGLRFATLPSETFDLDLDAVTYDARRQMAVARDGDRVVPLAAHSMGVTLQTSGQIPREDEIFDKR